MKSRHRVTVFCLLTLLLCLAGGKAYSESEEMADDKRITLGKTVSEVIETCPIDPELIAQYAAALNKVKEEASLQEQVFNLVKTGDEIQRAVGDCLKRAELPEYRIVLGIDGKTPAEISIGVDLANLGGWNISGLDGMGLGGGQIPGKDQLPGGLNPRNAGDGEGSEGRAPGVNLGGGISKGSFLMPGHEGEKGTPGSGILQKQFGVDLTGKDPTGPSVKTGFHRPASVDFSNEGKAATGGDFTQNHPVETDVSGGMKEGAYKSISDSKKSSEAAAKEIAGAAKRATDAVLLGIEKARNDSLESENARLKAEVAMNSAIIQAQREGKRVQIIRVSTGGIRPNPMAEEKPLKGQAPSSNTQPTPKSPIIIDPPVGYEPGDRDQERLRPDQMTKPKQEPPYQTDTSKSDTPR